MIEYLLILATVLIFAKILGELCERVGVPSILGELGTGILLGPALLGLIYDLTDPVFTLLAEVGIIMLLFVAGFEHVDIKGMLKYKKASLTLSLFSLTIPLIAVTLLAMWMGYPFETSLLLGIALSATSIGITVRALLDCNQINSKAGRTLLGTLVINDIIGLIMMAIVIGIVASTSGNAVFDVVKVLIGIGIFFTVFVAAEYLMPYIVLYSVRLRVEEAQFTLVFVVVLLTSFLAFNLGLSTMIGAFFAGIALSRSSILETESFSQKISSISYGLFIPFFFVMAGAMIDFSNLGQSMVLALMLLVLVGTLHISCGFIVAKLFNYGKLDFTIMGLGMLPHGEVTLVVMTALMGIATASPQAIAKFGGSLGVAGLQNLFSAALLLIAMSILIAPMAMRLVTKKAQQSA